MHGRPAIRSLGTGIGSALEQALHDLVATLGAGGVEQRQSIVIDSIHIGTVLQQNIDDLRVATGARNHHERGLAKRPSRLFFKVHRRLPWSLAPRDGRFHRLGVSPRSTARVSDVNGGVDSHQTVGECAPDTLIDPVQPHV